MSDSSSETIIIEDRGSWGWKLFVRDGEVTASKAIKYDGVLTYTTEDKYIPRGRTSLANLSVTEVIDRYESHTETSWGTLYAAVDEALEQFDRPVEAIEA